MEGTELFKKAHSNQELYDWIFKVESCLSANNLLNGDLKQYVNGAKSHGNTFNDCTKLISLLKTKEKTIAIPPITKRNQIFVAMWFSDEMDSYFDNAYKPVINDLNYSAMRIDKKEFNGSITSEIFSEISNSVALIADLTGNRGGVYYEAGIAKGLRLCGHEIQLIFTCKSDFFNNTEKKPHFDVSNDNIITYCSEEELKEKLYRRLKQTLGTTP